MSDSNTCRSRQLLRHGVPAALAIALATAWPAARIDALDAERAMSQYIGDRWGRDKGFPGGSVYAITQTADGYLWIGAEKGLVRFDGLAFRLFDPSVSTMAFGPTVVGVATVPDGGLWARLRGPALVRYDNGEFENMLSTVGRPDSIVTAMTPGRDGALLLSTVRDGSVAYEHGRVVPIVTTGAVPASAVVVSIAQTADGDLWLGTRGAGLMLVHDSRVTRITEGLPDLKINCLLPRDNGEVWIGTDKGVARWTGMEVTRTGIPALLRDAPAVAMTRDLDANVWIAAGSHGLLRVSGDRVSASTERGRSGGYVAAVFEDRDRNLWVGTDTGIERWRDPAFATYAAAQGVPSDGVGPVYVDAAGRIWFAPTHGGLYVMRDGIATPVTDSGLDRDVIYSIEGDDDDIWVGRQRGGLTRLRRHGNAFAVERFTGVNGLPQESVYAVHRTRDGAVWVGTLSGGASRFKNGAFTTYDTASGLASNTVASILDTADGTVWFATPNGLSALSRGGWRTYGVIDGLPSNDVNALFEDHGRTLWVGTARGLAVYQAGRLHALPHLPSVLRGSIRGIAEDRTGWLWIAGTDRVLRINREGLLLGTVRDGDVREYGVADGLLAIDGVKRHRTVVTDSRGRIWFAFNRGLSMVDPARRDGALPALTHIEAVSADGAPVHVNGPIRILSSRRRITLGYAGLSLSVPERVRFRYRLDGFDRDWSTPVAERQAVYTNLGPGRYRFHVMASNSNGLWNGPEGTLSFEVQPMFWQTVWFRLSGILLAAAVGWGLYRCRVHHVARQLNARFEERLAERTRIAGELHDTLLQGFVGASMLLDDAVDRFPEDSPARSSLRRVLELMRQVTDEARDAVRGLRSPDCAPRDLEQAFSGIQQELAFGQEAAYRVVVEGRPRSLHPAIRDEVYRIGREGLLNAFRHSRATRIEIELDYQPRELRLFVRDNGRGIDPDVLRSGIDGHWGITGMRERARRIGGTLLMRSQAATGTELELRVPDRVAFARGGLETSELRQIAG